MLDSDMARVDQIREPAKPGKIIHLEDVRDAHDGKIGVLFGKGPSLDSFDLPRRGDDIWATINEACKVIERPDYAFMSDSGVVAHLADSHWHPHSETIIIGRDRPHKHLNGRDWTERIVGPTGTILYYEPVPSDVKGGSSPAVMLYVFRLMGVQRVLMVGFDAWTDPSRSSWSDKINAAVPTPRTRHDYGPSNETIARALRETQVAPVWWHLEEDLVREGWNDSRLAS